jgi:aryl-alcohol dehydrogenase-like predicted oxidoreductase
MSEQIQDSAQPDRRDFLHAGAAGAAALAAADAGAAPDKAAVPRRKFGKTKDEVSILGVGGATLARSPSFEEAQRIAHEAIDAGINFFDNAWEYADGRAEEWMGRALVGKRRQVFLMTKVCTHGRGKDVAMRQLEESLKRLRTDHLDLWQIHECVYDNDPQLHFASGGVVEALDAAKKAGKVRYVGFTGHKHPRIHLAMLAHKYPFDAVQMPLNAFDASYRSFEKDVLPEVNRRGMAALGMKSLGGDGRPVVKGAITVREALRYAMSLPVTTTISGMDSLAVLRQNLGVARGFEPMTAREMQALRERCAADAGDGHLELYKSTVRYDGAVGREQHGYPDQKKMPL